jgi:hypothetical protein
MAEQMDKAKILDEMRTKYAALEGILAPLEETQMTKEGVNGDWSIKDVLAHITAWHLRLLDRLHAATWNEEPTLTGVVTDEEVDRLNEQFYKENKSRPLNDVLKDFRTTYLQIADVVQAMNEEDLIGPQRFAWMKGNPLYYLVAGDTYEHYEEHSKPIREWLVNPKQD